MSSSSRPSTPPAAAPRAVRAPRSSIAFGKLGAATPAAALRAALSAALGDLHLALCLHRVGPAAPGSQQPEKTIPAPELDALVELLLRSRPRARSRWLTLTFDDGYEDAASYIASRAPRYPEVEFLFFVCPAKAEQRAGFRWDLFERQRHDGAGPEEAAATLARPFDLERENARPELRGLAEDEAYRLATTERLRALAAAPNVALGNHTNCHFAACELDEARLTEDLRRSELDFARLFGPSRHFAFPFGIPNRSFTARDVAIVRAASDRAVIWSTESRPYRADERRPGGVVPRYSVLGDWPHRALAGWITGRALIFRARGPKYAF